MENELNLLLLEDDPADAELLQHLLRRSGIQFNAVVASDENEFHAALQHNNFHAVLADNALPQYSSLEALKLISATNPHVAFILVTGTVSEEFAVNIMRQGADDYLLKTNLTRLPAAIMNAVNKKRMERDKEVAKKEIEKEKELSDSIINSLPGVFFLCTANGRFIRWNKNFKHVTGYTPGDLPSLHTSVLFPEAVSQNPIELFRQNLDSGQAGSEVLLQTKDSKQIPYYFRVMPVVFENEECFVCIGLDITAKKESEEKLKALNEDLKQLTDELRSVSAHMEKIREEEQARIAREVHDQIGQQLTGLKMDLAWIRSKTGQELDKETLDEKLDEMCQMVDDAIVTVRKVASDLRPSILDDFGLSEAIEWESRKFTKRSGMKTEFLQPETSLDINPSVSIVLYRIYQEALTNAARHSEASKITTELKTKDNEIVLAITDNGKGFDITKPTSSLGLLGMKERAHIIGGKLFINSNPGAGTSIIVSVPKT